MRLIEQIHSIESILDFVYPNFPLVLFPGGEVREKDYNNWVRQEKNNEPFCKIYDFDIDDGCSRAVTYALNGIENVLSFVGSY
ncbi:MAG: hypothetical protein ACOYT4_02480 [Nanoarchaeota archaeon]